MTITARLLLKRLRASLRRRRKGARCGRNENCNSLHGHLLAFAPASGAEFALLPPDNATGNFTKVVQRIPIKIAIDDTDGLADRLAPGMSVVARIDARDKRP